MDDSTWVGVYLRKSRDKAEVADPELLSKHRRELLRLAESRGDRIPAERVFEEIGSGEKIDRRPVFLSLLEEIERLPRGHGGRLYTTEVSRLTRGDLSARGRIQGALQRAEIRHITRGREYDLTSADDRFVWELEAGMSGYELGRYKQRVEAARVDMAREGRLRTGRPPFGWRWDKNQECPAPVPSQFPIVQAMCREVFALSTIQLAQKYGLTQSRVWETLRNPFIAGYPAKRYFPHNGERDWQGSSIRRDREQWIWPERRSEDYPAACTLEEWDAIQAVLDRRRDRREKRNSHVGWCRDVLRFQGYESLTPRLGSVPMADKVLTYEIVPTGVPRLYVPRVMVHEAAKEAVFAILRHPEFQRRAEEAMRQGERPAPIALDATEKEIRSLEDRLEGFEDTEADAVRAQDWERVSRIKRRREEAEKKLKALRAAAIASPAPIGISKQAGEILLAFSKDPAGIWKTNEKHPDTLRQIVSSSLSLILVSVERQEGGVGTAYRREVVEVRPAEWVSLWEC